MSSMDLSLSYFIQEVTSNPVMMVTVALTLGVIFVNGWTDAPNAIATCIGTRSMGVRSAIMTSAVFNFLGVQMCRRDSIDVVYELIRGGYINEKGRLISEGEGRERFFTIWHGREGRRDIAVTQNDIREIQLAKGAIAAGICLLYTSRCV